MANTEDFDVKNEEFRFNEFDVGTYIRNIESL